MSCQFESEDWIETFDIMRCDWTCTLECDSPESDLIGVTLIVSVVLSHGEVRFAGCKPVGQWSCWSMSDHLSVHLHQQANGIMNGWWMWNRRLNHSIYESQSGRFNMLLSFNRIAMIWFSKSLQFLVESVYIAFDSPSDSLHFQSLGIALIYPTGWFSNLSLSAMSEHIGDNGNYRK